MKPVRLMYAASGHDADMLYATGFYADDPFLWWEVRGRRHIALSPLEIDRAKPVARGKVHAMSEFQPNGRKSSAAALITGVARSLRIDSFLVPEQFPAGLLEQLRHEKLRIKVSREPLFPERVRKTKEEVGALTAALRVAEAGLRRGIDVLRASRPNKRGALTWAARPSPLNACALKWIPPFSTPAARPRTRSWPAANKAAIRTSAVTAHCARTRRSCSTSSRATRATSTTAT